jgi:RNA polymerase sigma-70 factor (ECF subfamily)
LLLRQLSAGYADAFTRLFEVHWDRVYSAAQVLTKSPQMAEDIVQEVFLKLWQQRERAAAIEKLEGFLFITARNLIYNRMARQQTEAAWQNYVQYQLQSPGVSPAEKTELRELQGIVEAAIQQMPPQQQKAFRLSREKGLSHEQISQEMGVSKGTVKDYIVRAIAFLRQHLGRHASYILIFLYWKLF